MLSLSCKAGIKAVIFLGSKFESGDKTGIKEISKHINENEIPLEKFYRSWLRTTSLKV